MKTTTELNTYSNRTAPLCGELPCYADDAMYVFSSNSRKRNQMKLIRNLSAIKYFLNDNFLSINLSKTTLCKIMVKQKWYRIAGSPPKFSVIAPDGETKEILASQHIRLLGFNIQNNLGMEITSG